jgi:hypothetical protein
MVILFDRACLRLGVGAGSYRSNNLHHIRNPVCQPLSKVWSRVTQGGGARGYRIRGERLTLVYLNPSITF